MYILFKNVSDTELGIIKRVGSYLDYVIGYIDDSIKDIVKYEHLNPIIFEEDVVALAWKFTSNWKGYLSVKKDTPARDQLENILSSTEKDDVKVKYYLTDEDKSNSVKFCKIVFRKMLDEYFDKKMDQLNIGVSVLEESTWTQQRIESNAYESDHNSSVPLLTALAQSRQISVAEMSQKVQSAIALYNEKLSTLIARKQFIEQEIKSCQSISDCVVFLHNRFGYTMAIPFQEQLGITEPAKIDL